MAYPRINVRSTQGYERGHENWGKLVKTWSTGKNYVRHEITDAKPFPTEIEAKPEFPIPTTFAEFVAQAETAGVQLFFDDGDKNPTVTGREPLKLEMLGVPDDTAYVKVPEGAKILASEARLAKPVPYSFLPPFYERIHGRKALPEETSSPSQKAKLHAERVGEYTINTCG